MRSYRKDFSTQQALKNTLDQNGYGNAWKVSKCKVISGPYSPVFSPFQENKDQK